MGRTKAELEAENRGLRDVIEDLYDRAADFIEPDEAEEDSEDGESEEEE